MSDGPEWFGQKRYGFGSGLPISWQGWLVTAAFVGSVIAISIGFRHSRAQMIASLAAVIIAFIAICARTTRGGWRWRWGKDQD